MIPLQLPLLILLLVLIAMSLTVLGYAPDLPDHHVSSGIDGAYHIHTNDYPISDI